MSKFDSDDTGRIAIVALTLSVYFLGVSHIISDRGREEEASAPSNASEATCESREDKRSSEFSLSQNKDAETDKAHDIVTPEPIASCP